MPETRDRYLRAKAIYLEVVSLDEEARVALLDARCADDAELRAEVEGLLAAVRTEGAAAPEFDVQEPLPPGFRRVRELGRGGMGVVILAEREQGEFQQRVAVKLLTRDALRDPDRRARFRAERRILASLDHPHIARLLDGGTLANGMPYLLMEFVEGQRLDQWRQTQQPSLPVLVRLFIAICRAVQAAHQRLIVHRDLKPANILVDAYGAPKLLDFGIAKLLDDSGTPEVATGTGMQLLTPRYAAPEQVRGQMITTATDVYSLGVMLYEMLTGHSPYGDDLPIAEQLRAVTDTEPQKPSVLLRAAARTGATTGTGLVLPAALAGDLDAIVLKCLRKEAGLRYRGAAELADDLEAFLKERPVAARAGSTRYALGKFVLRHRYLVGSVAAILLILLSAALLLFRQLQATQQQRDLAAHERDRSLQVTDFLLELLREADPAKARGQELTLREALTRGESELARRLDAHPETQAKLLAEIARIHIELGDVEHGRRLAERALALIEPIGERHPEIRLASRFAHAIALVKSGQGKTAAPILAGLRADAHVLGDVSTEVESLYLRAQIESERMETKDALNLLREAEALLLSKLGIDSVEAALTLAIDEPRREYLTLLASGGQYQCGALADARDTAGAAVICRQTAALKSRLWPLDHPVHLNTQATLAMLAIINGDQQGSLQLRREILDSTQRIYGARHQRTAYAAFNLGVSLKALGEFEQAEQHYRQALVVLQELLGPNHRSTLTVMNNLANLLTDRGDPAAGLALHQQVLGLRQQVFGEQHQEVAQSLMNIASAERMLARHGQAIDHSARAVSMYQNLLGAQHHDTALATMLLAQSEFQGGRYADAEVHARAALAVYEQSAEEPDERGATEFLLAQIEWQLGRRDAARARAERALADAHVHGGSGFDSKEIEAWLNSHRADSSR